MPAGSVPRDVIDSTQAEWLHLREAAVSTASATTGYDDPLAHQLSGYRCFVEAWEHALQAGHTDAARYALATLARHVQGECLHRIRTWLSAGPLWDALVQLPLPPLQFAAMAPPMPGRTAVLALCGAALDYQREVDRFCNLYQSLGSSTLSRLDAAVAASAGPSIDTVAALYVFWLACQDSCEAEIVRREDYADCLAAVSVAAAALRTAHRQWMEIFIPCEAGQQRAFSDEIATLRRQLRAMAE